MSWHLLTLLYTSAINFNVLSCEAFLPHSVRQMTKCDQYPLRVVTGNEIAAIAVGKELKAPGQAVSITTDRLSTQHSWPKLAIQYPARKYWVFPHAEYLPHVHAWQLRKEFM